MAAIETPLPPRMPPAVAARRPARHNRSAETPAHRGMSFARTKIQPPRPRVDTLVSRPLLDAPLRQALLLHRLVLVSAAAGYGKTTALARQLGALPPGTALAWVAADEGDDLQRLLDCLLTALEPFDLPWRTAPEALTALAGDPRTRGRAADELLNALDACEVAHGVIVFDDLHRVDDGPFFEFLDRVLDRLGQRWTVAVATRHDPPLALARLRALGELAEFRQADLQFDRSEAQALAGAMGLDTAQADALLERTQGWAAGLRLGLGRVLQRGPACAPMASDRAMFDFLATEVIDQQSDELRDFLLRTAVLPELTAPRAAAVSGNARAALLMEQIDRLGLFVTTLEAAEPTLKLHDLFREALEQRLRRERPDEWPQLWQRAAAGESDPARQLPMLLRAGAIDAAAEALYGHVAMLLTDGALATVAHLIDQFPGAFVTASPVMQTVQGLLAWARWDFAGMAQAMQRAHDGFAQAGDADRTRAAAAYRSLALNALGRNAGSAAILSPLRREALSLETRGIVLLACLWHALDLSANHRVGPLLEEMVELLERSGDITLWYRTTPLARTIGLPGTAAPLQRYTRGALRLAGDKPMPLRALAQVQQGWHLAWHEADLDGAEAALAAAQDDSRWLGEPPNVAVQIRVLAIFVHALRGNRPRALATALAQAEPAGGVAAMWGNLYYAARTAALFDDAAILERQLLRLQQDGGAIGAPPTAARHVTVLLGHQARLAGAHDTARRLWQQALDNEAEIDRLGHGVETRLYLAASLAGDGRRADAAAVLQPLFERLRLGGVGAVLIARTPLARLAALDWQQTLDGDAVAQLRRWQQQSRRLADPDAAAAPPADEVPLAPGGLTAREQEVLSRIAAGDSNKLIARAFDLSPHTVKRHVANILDKLGAESRGQAAAWYLSKH